METAFHAPRILIVEPHCGGLRMMARRLGEAGYRVVSCTNAADAVAELHRAPVELVLAELRMEPTSGIALARLIWQEHPGYAPEPTMTKQEIQSRITAIGSIPRSDDVTRPRGHRLRQGRVAEL